VRLAIAVDRRVEVLPAFVISTVKPGVLVIPDD
jgi:hypothetical protein